MSGLTRLASSCHERVAHSPIDVSRTHRTPPNLGVKLATASPMTSAQRAAGVSFLLMSCVGASDRTQPSLSAVSRLASLNSSITWIDSMRAVGDIDCDGSSDTTVVGHTSRSMHLGIVFGSQKAPHVLTIGASPMESEGVRGAFLALEVGNLDYDPEAEDVGSLEGFQRSNQCLGLSLRDGDTAAYHTYWNHTRGLLDWWRR